MAWLNLSWLKITQDENIQNTNTPKIEDIQTQDTIVETTNNDTPSSTWFSFSLSSLKMENWISEQKEEKPASVFSSIQNTSEEKISEPVVITSEQVITTEQVAPEINTAEIVQDWVDQSLIIESQPISQETKEIKDESKIEDDSNKEMFSNFDPIKEFEIDLEDWVAISDDTKNTTESTPVISFWADGITTTIPETTIAPKEEEIISETTLSTEMPVIEFQDETPITLETITPIDNTAQIIEESPIKPVEDQTSAISTETIETNDVKKVEDLKKDLSEKRKPAWIWSLRKRLAFLSIFWIMLISVTYFWLNMKMKTNVWEFDMHWIQVLSWSTSNNIIIEKIEYKEWVDFTISKNRKKNIRRNKPTPDVAVQTPPPVIDWSWEIMSMGNWIQEAWSWQIETSSWIPTPLQ